MRHLHPPEPKKNSSVVVMIFHLSILSLLIVLCYLPGFKTPFLTDDQLVILEKPEVRGIAPLSNLFQTEPSRVLVYLSFALDYRLFRLNVAGYHIQSLLAHLLSSLLLYFLIRQLLSKTKQLEPAVTWCAFFSALIFGIHPINTEAVTYLSGRFTLFAGMFILISILCFERAFSRDATDWLWLIISYIAFLLSLLCKEEALVFPVLIVVFLWSRKETPKAHWLLSIPFVALLLFGLLFRYFSLNRLGTGTAPYPRMVYLATEAIVIVKYLLQFFFPIHLSYLPEIDPVKTISIKLIICIALLALILFSTVRSYAKDTRSFGILWMFLLLAPSSSIVPLEDFMALHRFYNAGMGLLISLSAIFIELSKAFSLNLRKSVSAFLSIIVVFFSILTIQRNLIFRNEISLFRSALSCSPKSARLLNDLGYAYYRKSDYERARHYLSRSLARDPDYFMALNNMGITLVGLGQDDEALKYFYQASERTSKPGKIYANIGMIYLKKGEPDLALPWLEKAVQAEPYLAQIRFYLGRALAGIGQYERALSEMLAGIGSLNPRAENYFELGKVFLKLGKISSARESFMYALQIDPGFAPARSALEQIQAGQEKIRQ